MQTGSIVKCVDDSYKHEWRVRPNGYLVKGELYTVKGVNKYNSAGILIEEKPNIEDGYDCGWHIDRFREIQSPINITEITEYQHIKVEEVANHSKEPTETCSS